MSEIKAEYKVATGEANDEGESYEIRDEAPHNYFMSIPNLIDDLELSVYAFRLYCHLKRVAGETGKCWQSTRTLATACQMSMGKVSEAKRELADHQPPLIRVTSVGKDNGGTYHEITITDIWGLNQAKYLPPRSPGEHPRSPHELPRSPGETKKNPIKKNPYINAENPEKNACDAFIELNLKHQEKQKEQEVIITQIETGLGVTPNMAKPAWETVIHGIQKRAQAGQPLGAYIRWCKSDKFNSPKVAQIAKDPHVILDTWPAAFASRPEEERVRTL